MKRGISLLTIGFLSTLLFTTTGKSFAAESAEELYGAAKYNEMVGRYYEAKIAYQQLLQQYPNSSFSDEARLAAARTNILAMIRARDYTAIAGAIDNLVKDFSGNPELPQMLWRVARKYEQADIFECEQSDMFAQAENLHKQIIQQYPDMDASRKSAFDLQKISVFKLIRSEPASTVQPAIDNIVTAFSGDPYLPMVLYDIGKRYEHIGNFKEATKFYQQIVQQYSGNWVCPKAQQDVRRLEVYELIDSGENADAAIDKIKNDFKDRPWLSDTLFEIGRKFEYVGNYSRAKEFYQQLLQEYPNSECAKALRSDIPRIEIQILIDKGDYAGAEAAIEAFKGGFANDPFLSLALYPIALKYEKVGRYAEAKNIHQQMITQHSYLWCAERSQMAVRRLNILSLIDAGQDAVANAEINSLMTDFSNSPHLASAVSKIAKQLNRKVRQLEDQHLFELSRRYIEKAAEVFELVVQKFADDDTAPYAYYQAGFCYDKLGRYEEAIARYQKILDSYPAYSSYAGNALYMIGLDYQNMKNMRLISKADAAVRTKAAYEQLLQKYPDCSAAGYAQKWLSENSH